MNNKKRCAAYKSIDGETREDETCKNCAFFSSMSCTSDVSSETSSLVDIFL